MSAHPILRPGLTNPDSDAAHAEIAKVVDEARDAFRGSPLERNQDGVINRFEDSKWDLEHLRDPVGSSRNRRLYFTVEGSTKDPLPSFVGDLFKAFVVFKHQEVKTVSGLANLLRTLRKLWEVMQDRRPVLRYQGSGAFRWATFTAADLVGLEELLHKQGTWGHYIRDLMTGPGEFASWLQQPHRRIVPEWEYNPTPSARSRFRIGNAKEREAWRISRLPKREALDLLAEFYWRTKPEGEIDHNNHALVEDRLMICVTALYLCGGFRVTEGATLPLDFLQSTPGDGASKSKFYVRYSNLKTGQAGAAPRIRWLSPLQALLVQEVQREILLITEPWRERALRLEADPNSVAIYDDAGNRRDDDELVETAETARLLGLSKNTSLASARPELGPALPAAPLAAGWGWAPAKYRIGDIKEIVQQDRVRWNLTTTVKRRRGKKQDQLLSESLLVVPVGFLGRSLLHHPVLVEPLFPQKIMGWLSGAARYKSIFEKIAEAGDRSEEIAKLRVRTHSFRHLLNYLARKRGMSGTLLNAWMQRAAPSQLKAYTHDAPADIAAAAVRDMIKAGTLRGDFVDHVEALPESARDAVIDASVQAAHNTSLGTCIANFFFDPCRYFGGCLNNCFHLLVERGNKAQLIQIQGVRRKNEKQLQLYDERIAAGEVLDPAHRERIDTVIKGCEAAEQRIQSGPQDGAVTKVFPDGVDQFKPYEADPH